MKVASETLRKVTLNLFAKDVDWLKDRYGYGYTEVIREVVRMHIRAKQNVEE